MSRVSDTHGNFSRFRLFFNNDWGIQADYPPDETGIIILGDAALNYLLNENDKPSKRMLQDSGYTWYMVRGNHEERPENIAGITQVYDENVCGEVWVEEEFPNIKYFKDGGIYYLNQWRTLVIGGAYSVDKYYRLARAGFSAQSVTPENRDFIQTLAHWFYDEQLSAQEQREIFDAVQGKNFDIVLSHTCPIQWEPTDLFLPGVDQSTVDKTTEIFLSEIEANIDYRMWFCGHYHAERRLSSNAQMIYKDIYDLADFME